MKTKDAESLSKFMEIINRGKCDNNDIFYRGQREDKELLPKLFREQILSNSELMGFEKKILEEFTNKARVFLKFEPKNDFEWLTIGQHHGLKTRLLDWTENALAALWFCVEKDPPDLKGYGVVWVFRCVFPDFYVKFDDKNKDTLDPFEIKETKILRPPYLTKRIIAQSGIFSVHYFSKSDSKAISFEKEPRFGEDPMEILTKIIIPYKYFDVIKKNLLECGIHSASLFPDLDGLCKSLNDIPLNSEKIQKILNK
jgi:hypothetical protein